MKYYIPTLTSNIDNILSSESVSPVSYYGNRNFGYKSFEVIDDLKQFKDILVLFDVIPHFQLPEDGNARKYPLIVEIEDDKQLANLSKIGEREEGNVYAFRGTIRLTPFNCRILFFEYKAIIFSQVHCGDSMLNKLFNYFHLSQIPLAAPLVELKLLVDSIDSSLIPPTTTPFDENNYNRIKGFMYGFYMGMLKDVSSEIAEMRQTQKKIYDIVAGVVSDGGKISDEKRKVLKGYCDKFAKKGPDVKRARDEWNRFLGDLELKEDKVDKLAVECNSSLKKLMYGFCEKKGIDMPPVWDDDIHSLSSYNSELVRYMNKLLREESEKNAKDVEIVKLFDVDKDEWKTVMLQNDDNEKEKIWFNQILNHMVWWGDGIFRSMEHLRLSKKGVDGIALAVTETVRDKIVPEIEKYSWSGSKEQLYFHHMRQNIESAEDFDIKECENIVLQSLCTFVLKGEDFDEILRYAVNNAIYKYRYMLGLWGATIGYVDMPKGTFFSVIPEPLFRKVYGEMYEVLWGEKLPELVKVYLPTQVVQSSMNEEDVNKKQFMEKMRGKCKGKEEKVWKLLVKNKKLDKNSLMGIDGIGEVTAEKIMKAWEGVWDCVGEKRKDEDNDYRNFGNTLKGTQMELPYDDIMPLSLQCFSGLSNEVRRRLWKNWDYTVQQNKGENEDQREHFINLCKKEGRGRLDNYKVLEGVFTEEFAQKVEDELKKYYANK